MTFDELTHDIEARTREKLSEADKNRFVTGPEQPTGDVDRRTFAVGGKLATLAHDGGKIYLALGLTDSPMDESAEREGHAVGQTSIEPLSEKIFEYLSSDFTG